MPTLEDMKIKPADEQGPVLTSRGRAATLREQIEQAVASGSEVLLDFEGVVQMSPSFADELIGKLDPALLQRRKVRLSGIPPSVKPLARFVIANRRRAVAGGGTIA